MSKQTRKKRKQKANNIVKKELRAQKFEVGEQKFPSFPTRLYSK